MKVMENHFTIYLVHQSGWTLVSGKTEKLGAIYNEIYKEGPLLYEIEEFDNKGNCKIKYCR